jgi:hypothetical protein
MKKVISALLVAPFAVAAIAQTPVAPNVTIADSTGNRPAVAAIVVPTMQEVTNRVVQDLPAPARPWTSYFLGQSKSTGTVCTRSQCYPVTIRIAMDGTIEYVSSAGGSFKLFDYPQWNEPLTRSSSSTMGCGGRSGNSYTETTHVRVAPTGVSISQLTPTGWTASYTISGSGGC